MIDANEHDHIASMLGSVSAAGVTSHAVLCPFPPACYHGVRRLRNAACDPSRLRDTNRFLTAAENFDPFFCIPSPAGAHEKGGVEAEVGRFRRIHLVPVPQAPSLADVNEVLTRMDGADDQRRITGKVQTVGEDFAQEAGSVCRGVLLLVEHAGASPPCTSPAPWWPDGEEVRVRVILPLGRGR